MCRVLLTEYHGFFHVYIALESCAKARALCSCECTISVCRALLIEYKGSVDVYTALQSCAAVRRERHVPVNALFPCAGLF